MKNIKRKIFQIILTVFMVFSSCFLTGTVEAIDDTGNANASNNLYVASNDIINGEQENNNTNNIPQSFISAEDGEGSDIFENDPSKSTEGGIYTDKVITKVDENGTYKITLYAKGYRYRYVNEDNQKVESTWLNPMADGSQLVVKENINENFKYVEDSIKVIKNDGLSKESPYIKKSQDVSLFFEKTDVNEDYTSKNDTHVAFDVEIEFQVTLKSFAEGTYNTSTAESYYKPAKDNFHYYEWGFDEKGDFKLKGIKWKSAGIGWEQVQVQDIGDLIIPDIEGNEHTFKIPTDWYANNGGISGTGGEYTDHDNNYIRDAQYNIENGEYLKDVGIEQIKMWIAFDSKYMYLRIEIMYLDTAGSLNSGKNIILEPKVYWGSEGGNRMNDELNLGIFTYKTDSTLREDFTLTDGLIKDVLDNHAQIVIDSIDSTNILQNKTAHVIDWDDRTYQIDLYASHNIITNNDPVNIIMMLDVSGSMPWFVSQPTGGTTTLAELMNNDTAKSDETIFKNNGEGTLSKWNYTYYVLRESESKGTYEYKPIAYTDGTNKVPIGTDKSKQLSEGWYYVKSDSNGRKVFESETKNFGPVEEDDVIYIRRDNDSRGDNDRTKLEALSLAVNNFVDNLKTMAPGSKISFIQFASDVKNSTELIDITECNVDDIINKTPLYGGTNQYAALEKAIEVVTNKDLTKENTYGILFTDGAITAEREGEDKITASEVEEKAADFKEKVNLLFGAGIFVSSGSKGETDLRSWVSDDPDDPEGQEKLVYIGYDADELVNEFTEIFGKITYQIEGVTVKDYIDNRFEVTDSNGDVVTIPENGVEYNGGILKKDDKGVYVEWSDVNLSYASDPTKGWHQTIYVKAKDEYIGGNDIKTNITSESGIFVGNIHKEFSEPHVNVKVDFVVGNKEETIFLGDTIPSSSISDLFDENKVYNSKGVQLKIAPDGTNLDESDFDLTWFTKVDNNKYSVVGSSKIDNFSTLRPTSKQVYYLQVELKNIEATDENSETEQNTKGYDNTEGDYLLATNDQDTIIKDNISLSDGNKTLYSPQSKYGVYVVDVVSGSITIKKNIDGNIADPNTQGDSIFTFLVEGETVTGKKIHEYKVLRFNTNNPQSFTITTGLEKGKYTITELNTIRYNLKGLSSNTTNCPVDINNTEKKVVFYIGCSEKDIESSTNITAKKGEATYTNVLVNNENYGDTDYVKNKFSVDENGKVTISPITGSESNESQNAE